MEAVQGADILLMAAAVADFKPAAPKVQKIKKDEGGQQIEIETTVDILSLVAELKTKTGFPKATIGFAAESQDLLKNAQAKLLNKRLDLIVANDITAQDAGFGVDTNRATIIEANGMVETLPLMNKAEVADVILDRVTALLQGETS